MKYLKVFVFVFVLFTSSLSFAATQFSNLGFNPQTTVYNPWFSLGSGYTQGFGFTATSTDNLSDIQIVLGNIRGAGNPTIYLYSASSSWTMGSLLESWTVDHNTLIPTEGYDTKHVTTLTSLTHAMLTAGSNYLIIGTNDANTNTAWYLNNLSNYSSSYYSQYASGAGGISGALAGAFAVNASPYTPPTPNPTPEPATMLLLGLGLAGLVGMRKKI